MILKKIQTEVFDIPLVAGPKRKGAFLSLTHEDGRTAIGEIAPLPDWNKETLEDALEQLKHKKDEILSIDWSKSTFFYHLQKLELYPSLLFALESALLTLYFPIASQHISESALLMGTPQEILAQAEQRLKEGYTSAKLKVGKLSFQEAKDVINLLKDKLLLRIDVNRAWNKKDSLNFFSQYSIDAFEYVEEPFQNPQDLHAFTHPLAIDESFDDFSLEQLQKLPTLKAIIYKPTVQGGLLNCLPIHTWINRRGIDLVLSSSFESETGLDHIASLAARLAIKSPIGIGTKHYLKQ